MALRGKPSVIYDRRCAGSRAYFNLADEIMTRYRQREGIEVAGPDTDLAGDLRATGAEKSAAVVQARSANGTRLGAEFGLAANLESLIGDLRAHGTLELPSAPQTGEPGAPEMVSLDELLAEEESSAQDASTSNDTWNGSWPGSDDPRDRLN